MFRLGFWLNLAAIACVVWADVRGWRAHEHGVMLAHAQMHARYAQCAASVGAGDEAERLRHLELRCAESLNDERWMPLFAPNLMHDTAAAAAPPMIGAVALVLLGFLAPRLLAAARARKATGTGSSPS